MNKQTLKKKRISVKVSCHIEKLSPPKVLKFLRDAYHHQYWIILCFGRLNTSTTHSKFLQRSNFLLLPLIVYFTTKSIIILTPLSRRAFALYFLNFSARTLAELSSSCLHKRARQLKFNTSMRLIGIAVGDQYTFIFIVDNVSKLVFWNERTIHTHTHIYNICIYYIVNRNKKKKYVGVHISLFDRLFSLWQWKILYSYKEIYGTSLWYGRQERRSTKTPTYILYNISEHDLSPILHRRDGTACVTCLSGDEFSAMSLVARENWKTKRW